MPASAIEALEGLLADGISAEEVLAKLEDAGYSVEPPAGDESYKSGEPAESDKPELQPVGGPQEPENRYTKAARKAMKKDKNSPDDEEEPMPPSY